MTQENFNLNDFEFAKPSTRGGAYGRRQRIADCCASLGVKGGSRKTNSQNLILTGFVSKQSSERQFGSLVAGANKFSKRDANTIIAFDTNVNGAAIGTIHTSVTSGVTYCSNKSIILALFENEGLPIPEIPGTSARFFFNLEAVAPKVFQVVPVRLEKVDKTGVVNVVDLANQHTAKPQPQPQPQRQRIPLTDDREPRRPAY